jgi:hypothetical protein
VICAPEGGFDYHHAAQPLHRIEPFQERFVALLAQNGSRLRRDRLHMTRFHDLLLRKGFEGWRRSSRACSVPAKRICLPGATRT